MARLPVIAATNYKGGVGKTITSRVLAQTLAETPSFHKGKKILVIDLDPQGNTSSRWNLLQTMPDGSYIPNPHPALFGKEDVGESEVSSICDLWLELLGMGMCKHPLPYATSNPMLDVVPAYEELMGEIMMLPREQRPLLGTLLHEWLRSPEMAEAYAACIIDTQPTKTSLVDAALTAATHAYVPFIPEPQSIEGVYSIVSYIYTKSQQRPPSDPLEFIGLLPNMVSSNLMLHRKLLRRLEKNPGLGRFLMPVKLGRRVGYAETDDWHNSPGQVTQLDGTKIAAEARNFARYITQRLEQEMPV